MTGNFDSANSGAIVQHWSRAHSGNAVNDRGYSARLRQAPRTRPLIENATSDRPMSIRMSGQGLVSKAENTAMVACSTNKKPNQQASAIFNPATAVVALRREISQAYV